MKKDTKGEYLTQHPQLRTREWRTLTTEQTSQESPITIPESTEIETEKSKMLTWDERKEQINKTNGWANHTRWEEKKKTETLNYSKQHIQIPQKQKPKPKIQRTSSTLLWFPRTLSPHRNRGKRQAWISQNWGKKRGGKEWELEQWVPSRA